MKEKFRYALADDPELLNFWETQKAREDFQLFMAQAKPMTENEIKFLVRKIKQIEEEESS